MSRSELTLDDIIPFLDGVKRRGQHTTADCPLCGKKGHLHIDVKDGRLLIYCQRCNAPGAEIFRELRRLGARPSEPEPAPAVDYRYERPVEDYKHIYRNPDGSEAYYKRRRKWADGHKVFCFGYKSQDGREVYSKPEGCNNLYNLDLLARHETDTLYIVEGEKCADAMVRAGFLATTSNTGAQRNIKLSVVDRELLESYPVRIVIPDNDEKGATYAQGWPGARILELASIWPDCPEKGDVADFLASGGDAELIRSYKFRTPINLDMAHFSGLNRYEMVDAELFKAILAIEQPLERQKILSYAGFRATELGMKRDFDKCWKVFLQSEASKGIKSDNLTKFPAQPFALRCGDWSTGSTGVFRNVQVGTEYKREYASPIPIMPTEILANIEDGTERIRVSFNKDGAWRGIVVPRSKVANKNRILDLADFGVEVNSDNAGLLVKYIADAVALNPDILPKSKAVDHLGWADGLFLPYTDEVKIDCEDDYRVLISAISEHGTLAEWTEYIRPLRENIYFRLIMAASFASPLIEKVGALPFVLHLWGGTGSGKTVAAMAAASIWGNPALGRMVRTMNMTVNSMMSTAALLRNIPFIGDELQTIKSRFENYDQLIMRVCEGIDRGRMSNTQLQKTKTWSNSFIFTGEEPCTKAASGGGVKNRVIEIECDRKIVENGNAVVNFIGAHYGCAGKVFIEKLDTRTLAADYREVMRLLLEIAKTTEKQAMAMALILLADAAASRMFWPGEEVLSIEDAAAFLKSAAEVDNAERAYKYVVNLIAENTARFETTTGDPPVHSCWGRIYSDGTIGVNKNVLERELEAVGFDFNACKKKWAEREYLRLTKQGRYVHKLSVAGATGWFVVFSKQNVGM